MSVTTLDPGQHLRSSGSDEPAADVAELGTILAVFAHPDDETYLAGGLMALAAARGQHVMCITATQGEEGGDPARRQVELGAALAALGVRRHRQLGFADGGCDRVDRELAVGTLAEAVRDLQPDTIVTFEPGGVTGHRDHIVVADWATEAVRRAAPSARLLRTVTTAYPDGHLEELIELGVYEPGYPVVVPDHELALRLCLSGDALDRKVAALYAHASQTDGLRTMIGSERYRAFVSVEGFIADDR